MTHDGFIFICDAFKVLRRSYLRHLSLRAWQRIFQIKIAVICKLFTVINMSCDRRIFIVVMPVRRCQHSFIQGVLKQNRNKYSTR